MIPLMMIMRDVLGDRPPEVALADRDDPIQALLLDRSHESSSAGQSHPRALSEPYVKLSLHTAPTTQPPASRRAATERKAAGPVARCASSQCMDARSRRRNRLYFRRTHAARAP